MGRFYAFTYLHHNRNTQNPDLGINSCSGQSAYEHTTMNLTLWLLYKLTGYLPVWVMDKQGRIHWQLMRPYHPH